MEIKIHNFQLNRIVEIISIKVIIHNVISMLEKEKWKWSIIKVNYEFQKGGNEMLSIIKN